MDLERFKEDLAECVPVEEYFVFDASNPYTWCADKYLGEGNWKCITYSSITGQWSVRDAGIFGLAYTLEAALRQVSELKEELEKPLSAFEQFQREVEKEFPGINMAYSQFSTNKFFASYLGKTVKDSVHVSYYPGRGWVVSIGYNYPGTGDYLAEAANDARLEQCETL